MQHSMDAIPAEWLTSEDDALRFYADRLASTQDLCRIASSNGMDAQAVTEIQDRLGHWFQLAVACAAIVYAA